MLWKSGRRARADANVQPAQIKIRTKKALAKLYDDKSFLRSLVLEHIESETLARRVAALPASYRENLDPRPMASAHSPQPGRHIARSRRRNQDRLP
jgi:hypothetical protein